MAAKMSALGLILPFYPYLRSAIARFPFAVFFNLSIRVIVTVTVKASCEVNNKNASKNTNYPPSVIIQRQHLSCAKYFKVIRTFPGL